MASRFGLAAALLVASAAAALAATLQDPLRPGPPLARATILEVPYLPQDELLCGGAAAAMVLRYWGMENVRASDFSSLVRPTLGGMRADELAANLAGRGWDPHLFAGSVAEVLRHVRLGRPVITLIEVAGGRFHYVVVVGEAEGRFVAHDPAGAPFEMMSAADLARAWKRTGGLSLVVLPRQDRGSNVRPPVAAVDGTMNAPGAGGPPMPDTCRATLASGVGLANQGRFEDAARALTTGECADHPAFLRESAGVRLRQGQAGDAASLARRAIAVDPADSLAHRTLATALYLDDRPRDALDAWNRVGLPTLDLIRIPGLRQARYRPAERLLGLRAGEVLTAGALDLAARRFGDLPAAAITRVGYVPTGGGRVDVVAGMVERTGLPTAAIPLVYTALRAAVSREVGLTVVSPLGLGETWSGAWRWWDRRPRVAFGFATPAGLAGPAVWRVDGSWEKESFTTVTIGIAASDDSSDVIDERSGGGVSVSRWHTAWFRQSLEVGADRWVDRGGFARIGATFESRAPGDHLGLLARADRWMSLEGEGGFGGLAIHAAWTTATSRLGPELTLRGGVEAVARDAPPTVWPGAGVGQARETLLRAHPLLTDGVIEGRAFDVNLASAGAEAVYWWDTGSGFRIGAAAFVDLAHPWGVRPAETLADAGLGVRLGTAVRDAAFRLDIATGLTDDEFAVSAGWWVPIALR